MDAFLKFLFGQRILSMITVELDKQVSPPPLPHSPHRAQSYEPQGAKVLCSLSSTERPVG